MVADACPAAPLSHAQNGVVIDAEKRSNDFGHISYLVTLEHPHTQQR